MSEKAEERPKTDPFEVATAILLGAAAIGAALASLQSGRWGGRQLEAFSQTNQMTTLAARDYNESISTMNADYAAVAQAKRLLIEAAEAETEREEDQRLRVASYFYTQQISWQAMRALALPESVWNAERAEDEQGEADDDAQEGEGAGAAAEGESIEVAAAVGEPDSAEEAEVDAMLDRVLPDDVLWNTLEIELHDEDSTYGDDLFTEPMAVFEQADAKFREGQTANENGDQFDLVAVYYTIALFFAGLGLVFKSSMRWPFFGVGATICIGATIFLATLPWA